MRPASDNPGTGIEVRRLTKQYKANGRRVVEDVTLSVKPGEFMTFLGPSGSGKSTTLSMIAGFTPVTSGAIDLDGVNVSRLPPHRRDLGMVFQNYALFPHMSAERNVAFPLRERKVPKAEIRRRVAEALELVDLADRGSSLPRNLSGGEQQRVALARALVYRPRALLLDEPLGALDKRLRESMQTEIARIHRELGVTFLFVTHDQEEALALSDHIAVFNQGKVEQVGTPSELYERPSTLFVARFLGDSNVVTGTQVSRDRVESAVGSVRLAGTAEQVAGDVAVVVRPERCSIHCAEPRLGDRFDVFAARVTGWTYLGASRKVAITFPDGTPGCVRERAGSETELTLGQSVYVSWSADDAWAVPAAAPGPGAVQTQEVRRVETARTTGPSTPAEIPTV